MSGVFLKRSFSLNYTIWAGEGYLLKNFVQREEGERPRERNEVFHMPSISAKGSRGEEWLSNRPRKKIIMRKKKGKKKLLNDFVKPPLRVDLGGEVRTAFADGKGGI